MNRSKFSTRDLAELALLTAVILLLAFTPLGYIRTAGLYSINKTYKSKHLF